MIPCTCIVQAGQISADTEATLRAHLNAFTTRAFGAPAEIGWMEIPEGSGFTAAKPSTSAVVSVSAPSPVAQETRKVLLEELCGIWTRETRASLDEIVGVIADPQTK